MKTRLPLIMCLLLYMVTPTWAQAPQQMNYQAVVRDATGNIVPSTPVKLLFYIHDGTNTGTIVFTDTIATTTNQFGLANIQIGSNATLSIVNWGNGAKYLQVLVDVNNAGTFTDMGTSQLISVPYSLFSGNSLSGPVGPTGAQGQAGVAGNTGTQGPTGAPGTQGITGNTGTVGATGATGPSGVDGTTGANGNNGNDGVTGATGATGGGGGATGPTGPIGNNGSNGTTGATGPSGTDGSNGVAGTTGATGPTGNNGNDGATGATGTGGGATGPTGATGNNGSAGAAGATGATGAIGSNGSNGATGATGTNGAPGAAGATGATGSNGNNGTTGATGVTGAGGGATGPTGATGSTGAGGGATGPTGGNGNNGVTGTTGPSGNNGATGPSGPQGNNGTNGATGAAGGAGATGPSGPQGNNGTNGVTGATGITGGNGNNGATGAAGPTGATGPTGLQGSSGNNGNNGATGPTGTAGATGATGFLGNGTAAGNTTYWNGTQWVLNSSNIYNDGGNIGIGTVSPASTLHVVGKVQIQDGTQSAGRLFVSDANGKGSWESDTATGIVGGAGITNYVARWRTANSLSTGTIVDDSSRIGLNSGPNPNSRVFLNDASGVQSAVGLWAIERQNVGDVIALSAGGFGGYYYAGSAGVGLSATAQNFAYTMLSVHYDSIVGFPDNTTYMGGSSFALSAADGYGLNTALLANNGTGQGYGGQFTGRTAAVNAYSVASGAFAPTIPYARVGVAAVTDSIGMPALYAENLNRTNAISPASIIVGHGYFYASLTDNTGPNAFAVGSMGQIDSSSAYSVGVYGANFSPGIGRVGLFGMSASPGTSYVFSSLNVGVYGYGPTAGAWGMLGNGDSIGTEGFSGNSTYGIGVVGFSSSTTGEGVYGESNNASGKGVVGINSNTGSSTTNGSGVYGQTKNTGLLAAGVYGVDSATSSTATGLKGVYGTYYQGLPYGTGVLGVGYGGVFDNTVSMDCGVLGVSTSHGVAGYVGTHTAAVAYVGVYASSSFSGDYALYANNTNGPTYPGFYVNGTFTASGTKAAIVPTESAGYQKLYCTESPEIWFEDLGHGKLVNGEVTIELEKIYQQTVVIDDAHQMMVFLQEEGESNGLIVIPGKTSFTVKEKQNGKSNISFSYRIMAKRRFYADQRFGADPTMLKEVDWSQYKDNKVPVDYTEARKYFNLDELDKIHAKPAPVNDATPPVKKVARQTLVTVPADKMPHVTGVTKFSKPVAPPVPVQGGSVARQDK